MNTTSWQKKPLILLGAGGHAKVLLSLARALNLFIRGVCAPELIKNSEDSWRGLEVLGSGEHLKNYSPDEYHLINGIGQRVDNNNRAHIFESYKSQGYYFPTLIHPNAWVDSSVVLGEGVQVMAGAIIQADVWIGKNVIINTQSSIDHDSIIEEHVHIAPGAVLCGAAKVSRGSFVATGACLSPGIKIGEYAVVGAGASIVRDVAAKTLVLPAAVKYTELETYVGEK